MAFAKPFARVSFIMELLGQASLITISVKGSALHAPISINHYHGYC